MIVCRVKHKVRKMTHKVGITVGRGNVSAESQAEQRGPAKSGFSSGWARVLILFRGMCENPSPGLEASEIRVQ